VMKTVKESIRGGGEKNGKHSGDYRGVAFS